MSSLNELSTEELRKELEQREGALSGLYAKRDELERELAELNEKIAGGGGSAPDSGDSPDASDDAPAADPPKRKRGRPKGSKNKPKTGAAAKTAKSPAAGRKRPKNDKPLPAVLADVLGGASGPMALDDIHAAVEKTGYKTSSKNFKNVIYQNLYNKDEFTKTGDGWVYKP